MSLKKVKGRPMFFLSVICLVSIKYQPFLYLMAILPGFSACIGAVSAPVVTNGIFVIKHYAEIYGLLSLFPGVGYALDGPLITSAYDVTGSYNVAWIITAALSIVMAAFLLYFYRSSRIRIEGQGKTGNTTKTQHNNGEVYQKLNTFYPSTEDVKYDTMTLAQNTANRNALVDKFI